MIGHQCSKIECLCAKAKGLSSAVFVGCKLFVIDCISFLCNFLGGDDAAVILGLFLKLA